MLLTEPLCESNSNESTISRDFPPQYLATSGIVYLNGREAKASVNLHL